MFVPCVAKRGDWVYHSEPESWLDAANVCAVGGGSLVSIKNERENQEFRGFVLGQNPSETYVWIGGNDAESKVRNIVLGQNFGKQTCTSSGITASQHHIFEKDNASLAIADMQNLVQDIYTSYYRCSLRYNIFFRQGALVFLLGSF